MRRFIIIGVTILLAQVALCEDVRFKSKDNSIITKDVLRGNVWNTIKTSAQNAWKMIENLAENTKAKINSWISNVINRAHKIKENIKESFKEMKDKSQIMLEELLGKTHVVKKCIKENEKNIDAILKKILENVTACISANINKVGSLKVYEVKMETKVNFNNTLFMESLEKEFNSCMKTHNDEECIEIVNKQLYEDINNIESGILATRSESRNVADDLWDSIVSCSIDGLMNASTSIAAETLQIVKCVVHNQDVPLYE